MKERMGLMLALMLLASVVVGATLASAQTEVTIGLAWGPEGQPALGIAEAAREFNAMQSEIQVTLLYGWGWDRVLVATVSDAAPDIVMHHNGPVMPANGTVVPLDAYMARDGVTVDLFLPPMRHRMQVDGKVYSFPLFVDPAFPMLYSREAFGEAGLDPHRPPVSIEEYEEIFPRLTRRGGQGQITQIANVPWSPLGAWTNTLQIWSTAMGGNLWDVETDRPAFGSDAVVAAMEWLQEYHDQYSHDVSTGGAGGNWKRLIDGLEAMTIDVGTMIPNIRRDAPEFDLGVAIVPSLAAAGLPNPTFLGGFMAGISVTSKHPDKAWEFLKFLASTDQGTSAVARGGGQFPAIAASSAYEDLYLTDPDYRPIVEIILSAQAPYFVADSIYSDDALGALEPRIADILSQRLVPRSALGEVQSTVLATIAQAASR